MDKTKIFPVILIVLNLGAAVVCAVFKDWKMMCYWLFAAGLNTVVIL